MEDIDDHDQFFQFEDGFLVVRNWRVYIYNNNLEFVDSYDTNEPIKGVLFDGTIVFPSSIGSAKDDQVYIPFSHRRILIPSESRQEVLDSGSLDEFLEGNTWEARFQVFNNHGMLKFVYMKEFETNVSVDFLKYFYYPKFDKSVLFCKNHIKIYDGELYSKQRFGDLLHGDKYSDRHYAILEKLFLIKDIVFDSCFPKHVVGKSGRKYVSINLENDDCYKFDAVKVVGISDDKVFELTNRINTYDYRQEKIYSEI